MPQDPKTKLLVQIHDLIDDTFDLEEFRDLCFRLGIKYDNLRGETLSGRIRDLVQQLDRKRRLTDLLRFCENLRPYVEWPDLSVTVDLDVASESFSASARNPRQVFLSHARQDADFAHQLAKDLRRHSWEVWIAPDSIHPGEGWVNAINRGLAESGVFLLILTPNAINSKWVNTETNVAIELEHKNAIRFFPLNVKPTKIPPVWLKYQRIPFQSDYKAGLEQLLQELQLEKAAPLTADARRGQRQNRHDLVDRFLRFIPVWGWGGGVIVGILSLIFFFQLAGSGGDDLPVSTPTNTVPAISQRMLEIPTITITPEPTWTATSTETIKPETTDTEVPINTLANEPTSTPTNTSSLTLTPALSIGSTRIRPIDEALMVYVPAGEFAMGSDDGNDDEQPIHTVYLDNYWIDKTEVTNGMYRKCEQAAVCERPSDLSSYTRDSYYINPEYIDYPVIYMRWEDAKTYCEWAGGRLPTEAEWEKAAGWDAEAQQARNFPWGFTFDGTRLNFCDNNCPFDWKDDAMDDGYEDTAPVDSYPTGVGYYGTLDMAGNVWEWTSSIYGSYPYNPDDGREDPTGTNAIVLRGGSWYNNINSSRAANRHNSHDFPKERYYYIGFRCAQD